MSIIEFSFCFRLKGGWAVVLGPKKTHFTCYKPSLPLVVGQVQGGGQGLRAQGLLTEHTGLCEVGILPSFPYDKMPIREVKSLV